MEETMLTEQGVATIIAKGNNQIVGNARDAYQLAYVKAIRDKTGGLEGYTTLQTDLLLRIGGNVKMSINGENSMLAEQRTCVRDLVAMYDRTDEKQIFPLRKPMEGKKIRDALKELKEDGLIVSAWKDSGAIGGKEEYVEMTRGGRQMVQRMMGAIAAKEK